jgi:peroxiredoxin
MGNAVCSRRQAPQIALGATLPEGITVDDLCLSGGFSPKGIDFKSVCEGGKVIVLGQPGAFTPC